MESIMELLTSADVDSSNLVWEGSQFVGSNEQEIEEVQVVQATPFVKPKGRKSGTKNFSEKEDTLLAEAWLEISLDGAQSNEQHRSMYWERIHEYYNKNKTIESDRSMKSLVNRWGTILECTNRFCGCYTQIENRNESGKTEQDRVLDACEMYKAVDLQKRSFNLLHCWHVLRYEQKWNNWCSHKNQKISPGTNESHHDEEGECHTSPSKDARPPGKKKAKEQQHGGKNLDSSQVGQIYKDALENMWTKKKECEDLKEKKRKERDDMFFALEQQRINDKMAMEQRRLEEEVALERKKHEEKMALEHKRIDEQVTLEKKKHEEKMTLEKKKLHEKTESDKKRLELHERELDGKVMTMDLSRMSEIQQQYYRRMQEEILARRFGGGSCWWRLMLRKWH